MNPLKFSLYAALFYLVISHTIANADTHEESNLPVYTLSIPIHSYILNIPNIRLNGRLRYDTYSAVSIGLEYLYQEDLTSSEYENKFDRNYSRNTKSNRYSIAVGHRSYKIVNKELFFWESEFTFRHYANKTKFIPDQNVSIIYPRFELYLNLLVGGEYPISRNISLEAKTGIFLNYINYEPSDSKSYYRTRSSFRSNVSINYNW